MADAARTAALIWDRTRTEAWSASLSSLRSVGGLQPIILDESSSFSAAVQSAFDAGAASLLVLTAPVLVPSGILDFGAAWMREDPRIATVSFLTNAPGALSFPIRDSEVIQDLGDDTAHAVTEKLRNVSHLGRVHITIPQGGAVLLSRSAFSLCGGLLPEFDDGPELAIADFALRAARRGLFTLLDVQTFVMQPVDTAAARPDYARLNARHPSFAPRYEEQRASDDGPLPLALGYAQASYRGLRILIDGSCLGPLEMGTQVQTAAFANALAQHPAVQWVGIGIPGTRPPEYARSLLTHDKIRLYPQSSEQLDGADEADILHRPFQPSGILPFDSWRAKAKRIAITVLDFIAYRNATYLISPERWLQYRSDFHQVLGRVDGALAISSDVRLAIEEEKFSIASERLFVAPLGTDHLSVDAKTLMPSAVAERGWETARFALVLGTDYTHKNRDVAIRVCSLIRQRGYGLNLVLAGPSVPVGSARKEELAAGVADASVLALPDVAAAERNWLLRNAALVLYPTSAEGFGLVPFEAAAFGTPTVAVSFGSVREFDGPAPMAGDWQIEELARVAQTFLDDPEASRAAVHHTLQRAAELTWACCADKLVHAYFKLLSLPPVETRRQLETAEAQRRQLASLQADYIATTGKLDRARFLLRHLADSRAVTLLSRVSTRLKSALDQTRWLLNE